MEISWYNNRIFLVVYFVIFLLILYKIFHVPITHDEVSTIFLAEEGTVLSILISDGEMPNNNHILNTLLTKFSLYMFGMNPLSVRLPNLMSFIVFSAAVYRLLTNVIGLKSWLFIPASLFFVTNLYFLDFFGLSRGYALSISFCILSISYIIPALKEMSYTKVNWSVLFAFLSVYSNFTLIYFWAIILLLASFFYINKYKNDNLKTKHIILFLTFIILFLVSVIPPLQNMISTNQFKYWTSNGFIDETVQPLIIHSLYGSKVLFFQFSNFFLLLFFIVTVSTVFWSFRLFLRKKNKVEVFNDPLFIVSFILIGVITLNVLHVYVTDVPNLKNRIALFYFPLFILVLVFGLKTIQFQMNKWLKGILSVILSVLCILQFTFNFKLDSVREWSYDANTLQVVQFISNQPGGNPTLSTDWKFNPSFYYYYRNNELNDIVLNSYSKELNINSGADYYYIFENDFNLFDKQYRIVKKFEQHTLLIMKYELIKKCIFDFLNFHYV